MSRLFTGWGLDFILASTIRYHKVKRRRMLRQASTSSAKYQMVVAQHQGTQSAGAARPIHEGPWVFIVNQDKTSYTKPVAESPNFCITGHKFGISRPSRLAI
jgi:hypothetical protein